MKWPRCDARRRESSAPVLADDDYITPARLFKHGLLSAAVGLERRYH
jgi:hypothetical protein